MLKMVLLATFFVIFAFSYVNVAAEWSKLSSDFFNMNVLCAQCGEVCERVSYGNIKDAESVEAQHWACYLGCRTTCLLQVGSGHQKYDYDAAKRLCVKGCLNEYRVTEDTPNLYSVACINACSSKVIPAPMTAAEMDKAFPQQMPAEEPDEILFDPALREQYFRSGNNMPHSKYQTLPRRSHRAMEMHSSLKQRLSGPSFNDYLVNFIRDHRSDLLLAGLIGLSLSLLSGILLYRVLFISNHKNVSLQVNASDGQRGQLPVTVLQVELDSEVKSSPLSHCPGHAENVFIPPPTPPPKYSDVVQTV